MKKIDSRISREVDLTLQSADDIRRVEGNPFLLTRIRARMAQEKVPLRRRASQRWLWPVAASLVLLNFISLLQFTRGSAHKSSATLYDYYYQSPEKSDLYDLLSQ
ncbi:MAG: hypothetical protein AAFW73_00170 [Bacteroidota bacterium]